MIVDTGPLVLLLTEKHDTRYETCLSVFEAFRGNLVTTLPCLTEVMYFLGGWHHQEQLWSWISDGSVQIYDLTPNDLARMEELMGKYENVPMAFADASLAALAEASSSNRVFTLDSDFTIYRFRESYSFEIIP
ncbi:PIN domain-containing protein [soil metagenome]